MDQGGGGRGGAMKRKSLKTRNQGTEKTRKKENP